MEHFVFIKLVVKLESGEIIFHNIIINKNGENLETIFTISIVKLKAMKLFFITLL